MASTDVTILWFEACQLWVTSDCNTLNLDVFSMQKREKYQLSLKGSKFLGYEICFPWGENIVWLYFQHIDILYWYNFQHISSKLLNLLFIIVKFC